MNVLALDVGTTSMRGLLFESSGKVLTSTSIETPSITFGACQEQSPTLLRDGLIHICKTIRQFNQIDAVSLAALRSTPALFDENGAPLCNFILWRDTRNQAICEEIGQRAGDLYHICGAPINTVFSATKLTWLHRNFPDLYARARRIAVIPDYLLYVMTGEFATDRTYGSRSLLMNLHTLEWDDGLCDLFEVDREKLCRLIDQGTVAGSVSGSFCELTGIRAGTPVISAGGDQQCAALGSGLFDDTAILINSGTGSYILACVDEAFAADTKAIYGLSAIRSKYLAELSVPSCAVALNGFMDKVYPELGRDYSRLNEIVANALKDAPSSDVRDTLALSLYRSLVEQICDAFHSLPASCGDASTLLLSGGLSKSAVYNSMLANALDRSARCWRNVQSTAIGAFVSAAVALGTYKNHRLALDAVHRFTDYQTFVPDAAHNVK